MPTLLFVCVWVPLEMHRILNLPLSSFLLLLIFIVMIVIINMTTCIVVQVRQCYTGGRTTSGC